MLGVDPSEVVMVDDRPDNVAGAERAGMTGVLFTTPDQVQRAVSHQFAPSP